MNVYCPNCGSKLEPVPINHDLWMRFFRCQSDGCGKVFVKVIDMKNDYPLIEVFPNIPDKVNDLSPKGAKEAWSKVHFVDYKTVSVVDFEHYVLGI
jgi:hypothetical protein